MSVADESQSGTLSAGELIRRRIETDPAMRAAWEEAQPRVRELIDELRNRLEWIDDELAARHFDPPRSIDDWEHLARIVEIPPDTISRLTAGEIIASARAWADRQKIRGKLVSPSDGGKSEKSRDESMDKWSQALTVSQLAKWFKVSSKTMMTILDEETIPNKKLSDRLYQVSIDRLPHHVKQRLLRE